jgi:hypothetical protein
MIRRRLSNDGDLNTDLCEIFIFNIPLDFVIYEKFVRFEVLTAVTMKNGVFWDVTPCGSCKNRSIGIT